LIQKCFNFLNFKRVLAESLLSSSSNDVIPSNESMPGENTSNNITDDYSLSEIIAMSKRENDERERQAREEEEELKRIIQLSLTEK
jgi:hypothetical protein